MIVITGGSVNLDLNYSWASIYQLEVAHEYIGSRNSFWGMNLILKMAIYCPQGSGTLRQQLLMMNGIAWYCMVLHGIALYCMVLHGIA